MMPRVNTPGFILNCLEIFACFVAPDLSGKQLRGFSVNCYTYSTTAHSWLRRLTGPE